MKNLSEDMVRKALVEYQSAEFGDSGVTYYLHINSDGDIVHGYYDAKESFTCSAGFEEYGITEEEWNDPDTCMTEDIYDHEVNGDPVFDRIVRDLTEQANEWLSNEEEETK